MGHVEPLGHARSGIDIDVNGLEAGRDQGLNFGTRQRLLLKAGRFRTPARGEDREHGLVAHGRCRPRGRQRRVPRNLGERCRATDEDRSPSHGSCRRVAEPPCQPSIRLPKHGFGLALEDSGPGRPPAATQGGCRSERPCVLYRSDRMQESHRNAGRSHGRTERGLRGSRGHPDCRAAAGQGSAETAYFSALSLLSAAPLRGPASLTTPWASQILLKSSLRTIPERA